MTTLIRPRNLKRSRAVGRGGKRGKTSGRGTKGQLSRTGNSTRPEARDIIKKFPKLRGHGKNRSRTVVPALRRQVVNLDQISTHFEDGSEITARELLKRGLVRREKGRAPTVKVLARGELTKKVTLKNLLVSKGARDAVQKAGGSVG